MRQAIYSASISIRINASAIELDGHFSCQAAEVCRVGH